MCGIFGVVLDSTVGGMWKDAEVIENLLYLDALRGKDSTGIAMMFNDGGARLTKAALDANDFIKTGEWASIRQQFVSRGKVLIAHNRKKTVGSINDATSHPFLINDRHLFIHNGTLYSHKHLADTEVDSEALGMHITKCEGNKELLEKALDKVYGAYACSWIDKEKEMLYLLRNKDRPLWLAKFDGGWMFCSEADFMRLALGRQGMKIEDVQEVPAEALISFDLSKTKQEPITEALTIKKSTPTTTHTQTKASGQDTTTESTNCGQGLEVSKNSFKRIAKRLTTGTKLYFNLVDYIPQEPNNKDCRKWFLLAESDELEFAHTIHFRLAGVDEQALYDFYLDQSWIGEVSSISYDNKKKEVNIVVKLATWVVGDTISANKENGDKVRDSKVMH